MSNGNIKKLFLDLHEVALSLSLSESTIQQLVRDQAFPKPRQLSKNRVGYLVREITEWAEARPISKLLPPPNTGAKKPKPRQVDKGEHQAE